MNERKEENTEEGFDEKGFDPTKEAFFSDLIDMEEEVANEAYELVEHAIRLVETKYFDDSIEILRQAIGLYTQINRVDEINAINEKISEVYLLKEQAFRERETEKEVQEIEEGQISERIKDSGIKTELIQEEVKIDKLEEPELLIKDGEALLKANKFEEALDKYDQAVEIFEEVNNSEGVDRVYKLIEECYTSKAEFLRGVKKATPAIEIEPDQEQLESIAEKQKEERLEQYLTSKKKEEELSSKAYDILGEASELAKTKQYDDSLQLYKEAAELFTELNWSYELKKVQDTIIQLENEKLIIQKQLEQKKEAREEQVETQIDSVEVTDVEAKEQERLEKLKRVRAIELQKMENEFFKAQIDNMVSEAARMAREYEIAMQKAIKKGELVEECIYPRVIQIYERVKELLTDKGWRSEATLYENTIGVYYKKLEQDKKIRQIEVEKAKKQKEAEEFLKVKEEEIAHDLEEEKLKTTKLKTEEEEVQEEFEQLINDMIKKAELMAREYDLTMKKAVRQGKLADNPPFDEIIKIYERVKQMVLSKQKNAEVSSYNSQIDYYSQQCEKDKKLREIEAQKVLKQKDIEEMHKVSLKVGIDEEKLKTIKSKEEEKEFEQYLSEAVNKAEKLVREHEMAMRKAMRKGRIIEETPYSEVIDIYKDIREKVYARGWKKQAEVYTNQIKIYEEKLENHIKLLEVEAKKAEKQKQVEEMYKIGKDIPLEEEKISTTERKKAEEEEFERFITENINKAEKLVRDHEMAMRKAMRKGEIVEETPYSEVIDIYKDIREKVYARGWKKQAEVYANQIIIYEEKLENHIKLLEVEAKKAEKQKQIEEMYKVGKDIELEEEKLSTIERIKAEEEEFERFITENINKAEKLVREHEMAMRKAMRKGKIIEETPYSEVIDIYKDIREKVYARGWKEQAEVYANQIMIYQERLDKHVKLLEIEAKKAKKQKEIDEMYKMEKEVEIDQKKMSKLETKKKEEEFQEYITDLVNKASKLEREYDSALKKAIKRGEIIEKTPYPEIIEIYEQIRNDLIEREWIEQAQIYSNQIKIYKEKLEKSEKLRQIEAKKAEKQKEIDEMYKIKEEVKPEIIDKRKELEEVSEDDILLDNAMNLIDEAERLVKNYEISIRTDVLLYESPYEKAISNYQEAKKIFQKIGWNDEASRLTNTIKFYNEKKEKDEKLRLIEKKKLEEPTIELGHAKDDTEKDLLAREKMVLKLKEDEEEKNKVVERIFDDIHEAERIAKEYEIKIKNGILDFEPPYVKILDVYREARKKFEEVGWIEESMKLINTIKFYKEKQEKDNRLRSLEIAKVKKRDEELLRQQHLLEKAKEEQERLLKQRKESLLLKEEEESKFESAKNKAFELMDNAKNELNLNNFEKAIELYNESEKIFSEISWQEGVNMVRDSIAMIKRRKKSFELEQAAIENERIERMKIEEKFEERIKQAEELRKIQQEEKRKEFLKIQSEKQWEKEVSEEAYKLLENGTSLLEGKKFDEAYEKYIEARKLFEKISWKREVSRINNELLFKLSRERKTYDILEDIKKKKVEEEKQMEMLKKEAEVERRERKRQKKEDKRKLAREEFDKMIMKELERARKHIDDLKYNEGILLLIREKKKLVEDDEIKNIDEIINSIKTKSEIPIITLEPLSDIEDLEKFESTYKALDKAQISLENNRFMKAISELNEAKSNLPALKIGKKYIEEIDAKIGELQEKLGRKPGEDDLTVKEKEHKTEMDILKARITARREERRKKVLDLLKKD